MKSRLWKLKYRKTAFREVLRFPLWAFSERSRINPLQAQSLAFPLSGVSLRGLSLYELCQLWQIVIFVAFGGNVASLKFKSILPRWHWQRVQTLLKEPVWTKKSFAAVPSGKSGKGKSKDVENGNGNHQPSADKSFYENLPFHGLKSPPKQVDPLW